MILDEILSEFGDFVEVVEQPEYSKNALLDFQKRYLLSTRVFYELYLMGFENTLIEIIPDYEDWLEHIQDFLKFEGDLSDLDPPEDIHNYSGQTYINIDAGAVCSGLSFFLLA